MSWIGVDLDGTLAEYHGWVGPESIGKPVFSMLERVKNWRLEEIEVRIFTARCYPLMYVPISYSSDWTPGNYEERIAKAAVEAIRAWCKEHIGAYIPITCVKDYEMYQLWDDRAVQIEQNTGRRMDTPPDITPIAEEQ